MSVQGDGTTAGWPPIVVLAGATGTGKTALSLDVAAALAAQGVPAEVVNADAMQLYRGMEVGTAKLPAGERRGVPHHLLDLWEVHEAASVALYRDAARAAIERIRRRGAVPLLVGGSGLYVEAVLRELDFPATDPELRAELERQAEALGPDALWRRLAEEDPAAAQRIPSGNLRRVVRALEVVTLTGRPYAASLPDRAAFWRPALRFVVEAAKDELAARLDRRARTMWSGGLLDEVRGLLPRGLADGPTASRAIGYAQAIAVLGGRMTVDDGTEETIRLTWRMVRRQRAWFGRDEGAVRLEGGNAVATVLGALAGAPGSLAR
ncbi:tRNA (adenosine(37)-N6)-dimethylallyltransferase MiaA [Amnibacterium sp. CER49]|uniref:tRNA (adenosine(37)-N6)-dimethylallyltransferase MiaA n=1 Tax=Amnibacterium sp. CER49 TaxID=3039161 RepID=UPI002449D421|nr:tRNA (adenosine(37)-N6)-dimethylallyltransferase MiaA [Amnibacterium sp. CER49]MDH2444991.1 tRNA (adenosine(37)-N6)-dimethylallyltransferase MiaA [Amnibacterium sp. CER49]